MKTYTDYPILRLGDISGEEAPIREVELISYDSNKYVEVSVEGLEGTAMVKAGYIYSKPVRLMEWGWKSKEAQELSNIIHTLPVTTYED